MCAAKCFSCFFLSFPQPIPGRLFLQLGLGDTIRQMVRLCREVYPLWRARACHAVNLDLRWMVTLLWVSRQGLSGNSWCFDLHKTMWHVVYRYKTTSFCSSMGKSRYKLAFTRHKECAKAECWVPQVATASSAVFLRFLFGSTHYVGFPKSIQVHPNQHAQNHKPSSSHHPVIIQSSSSHPKNLSVQPILIQYDPEEWYLLLLFDDSLRCHLHCFLSVWSSSHSHGRHLEVIWHGDGTKECEGEVNDGKCNRKTYKN